MVLPMGETSRISLSSYDVLHGFYVPEFNFSRYASPAAGPFSTSMSPNTGVFRGQCTQLCGLYHSLMFFNVSRCPRPTRPGSRHRAFQRASLLHRTAPATCTPT